MICLVLQGNTEVAEKLLRLGANLNTAAKVVDLIMGPHDIHDPEREMTGSGCAGWGPGTAPGCLEGSLGIRTAAAAEGCASPGALSSLSPTARETVEF